MPQMSKANAEALAKSIYDESVAVTAGTRSWEGYFSTLNNTNRGYVVDLIKNTEDLSKLTGDDLVQANQNARQAAITHNTALKQQTLGAKATSVAMKGLALVGNVLLTMAITKGVEWLLTYNQRLEESRQEMIEAGKEASQLTKDLDGLVEQYRKLGEDGKLDNSDREQARNIQEQINSLLGDEVHYIDLSNGGYEHQLELLRKIQHEKANDNYSTITDAKNAAEESLRSKAVGDVDSGWSEAFGGVSSERKALEKLLKNEGYDEYLKKTRDGYVYFGIDTSSSETIIKSYEDMIDLRTELSKSYAEEIKEGGNLHDFYNNLDQKIKDMADAVTKYQDALDDYNINQSVIHFNETDFGGVKGALIDTKEEMQSWAKAMVESEDISDGIKENLIGFAKTYYPDLSDAINESVQAHYKEKYAKAGSSSEIGNHIKNLDAEAEQCGLTKKAYIELISQEILFNNSNLDVTQKISALQQLAYQAGITAGKMREALMFDSLQKAYDVNTFGIEKAYRAGRITKEERDARKAQVLSSLTSSLFEGYEDGSGDKPPSDGGGNDSSSSKSDTPDKADPTDAIINRIASNVEALERQGEIIDNQLDMVDAEKEYDKYVELTNKALDNRLKTIEASKTAQSELSKEAQKIRDKYKGVDVESFFDADGDFTEAYNKYYDSFGSKAKQEAFADDMKMIQAFKKEWFEYYDDIMGLEKEVFDLRKDLQEAHYDHLSNLIDQLERHADLREKQAEDDKEYYDYLIDKEQALLDMKKAQFGLENKLLSARREAEKALATSKIGSEYLDEETRKLVYNDDDYKLEIDKIDEISDYVEGLTEDYIADINALGEDEMYKAEEITAQYERRIAIKEKELEIVQAEIDLQKKQDTLNNVLAEKNIRQIVDGKWVWTHDTDQLRQATEDLADAEAQVEQLKREKEQLEYTNSLEARIGQWQLEQEAIDKAMDDLHDKIEEFSTKVELLKDPLENFADIVNELNAELGGFDIDYESGAIIQASPASTPNAGRPGSADPNANVGSVVQQMMNNSTMWHVSDSATKEKLHNENKKLAASIGADYNPANGKYYQNGVPLYDGGGVLEGLGGIKATKEDEIVLPPNITGNILDPKKNALFDTFANNLETIFNPDLMPIKQIPFNVPKPNLRLLDTVTNRNTVVNYNMNGDVNINEAEDGNKLLQTLTNKIKSMPIPD